MPYYLPGGRRTRARFDDLTVETFLHTLGQPHMTADPANPRVMILRAVEGRMGPLLAAASLRFELEHTAEGMPLYAYLCVVEGQFDLCQKTGDVQLPQDVNAITQADIDRVFPALPEARHAEIEAAFAAFRDSLRPMRPEEWVAGVCGDKPPRAVASQDEAGVQRLLTALCDAPVTPEQAAACDVIAAAARDPVGWMAAQEDILDWPEGHVRWFVWPSLLLSVLRPVAPLAMVEGRDDAVGVATALEPVVGRRLDLPDREAEADDLESAYDRSTLHLRDAQAAVSGDGVALVRLYDFGDHDLIGRVPMAERDALAELGGQIGCPIRPVD